MELMNYICSAAMPMMILGIIIYGVIEKKKVYEFSYTYFCIPPCVISCVTCCREASNSAAFSCSKS